MIMLFSIGYFQLQKLKSKGEKLKELETRNLVRNKIKLTVSAMSSDPPGKDVNARFTTVSLQALCLINLELDIHVFVFYKLVIYVCKRIAHLLLIRSNGEV